MPVGEDTLNQIVAATVKAVGEYVKAETDSAVTHFQIIGEDVKNEIRREMERQRKAQDDPVPVPAGTIDKQGFWRSLFGLLASVGLHFDDLYAYVIKRGPKPKG